MHVRSYVALLIAVSMGLAAMPTPTDAQVRPRDRPAHERPETRPPDRPRRAVPGRTGSQVRSITPEVARKLASFDDARSVAVDPGGRLYVTDARRSTVHVLDLDGREVGVLGGRGAEAGAFDEPVSVDPTNGLSLFVADAGNGRVQHFSRNQRYIEALPVGRVDPAARGSSRQPVYDAGRDGQDARADGRPVAVASAPNGDLFVLDARDRIVVRYDRQRRPEPFAGGFDDRDGGLIDPVDLALGDGVLYVLDAGRPGVGLYDRFGTLDRWLFPGLLETPRSLFVSDGLLYVVEPGRIFVTDPRAERLRSHIPVDLNSPLVDAAIHEGRLFLLTKTAVHIVKL